MKTILSLFILLIAHQQACSEENFRIEKYSALKFIGPETRGKAAAKYTEKHYTLPAYKLALNAYKQLKILAKKKQLSTKQLKLAEIFKRQILDYKFWLKVSRIYQASHISKILQPAKEMNDPISSKASSISMLLSKQVRSLYKNNKHLTEKKGFLHPSRASYNSSLNKQGDMKELPQKLREKLLKVLEASMATL